MNIHNPYEKEYNELVNRPDVDWLALDRARTDFIFNNGYSWAIPSESDLVFITRHFSAKEHKLVSIGAGSGYFEYVLQQIGYDIVAYDIAPPNHEDHENKYFTTSAKQWFNVRKGDHTEIQHHADRVLFMCWPTSGSWVSKLVRDYHRHGGQNIIYIGEKMGGCTGTEAMWEEFELYWDTVDTQTQTNWYTIHSYIHIFSRKGESK